MARPIAPVVTGQHSWRVFREGLYDLFWNETDKVDDYINLAFHVDNSTRSYEELYSYAGVGNFNLWSEGTEIAYDVIEPRYLTTITNLWYSKGLRYTLKMKTDAKYNLIRDAVAGFAKAAAGKKQETAMDLLNDGFTTVWNSTEAQYLFSASHPLSSEAANIGSAATTDGNLVTGGLSLSKIEEATTMLMTTLDDLGRPMHIKPKRLWIHPANIWTAERILNSPDDPSLTERSINPIQRRRIEIQPCDLIDTTTKWFLQGDYYKTMWYNHLALDQKLFTDPDTRDDKHNAVYSASCGVADWRGWVGSLGT